MPTPRPSAILTLMRAAPAKIALLVSLTTLSVGCSRFAAPTLKVVDARVAEQTAEGISVDFILEGSNSNGEEIPLQLVKYSLSIDGERVFKGERMAEATLRRFGSQRFVLPVASTWENLPGAGTEPTADGPPRERRYRLSGTLQYIAPGALAEVFFDTGVRRPSVSFATEGELIFTPSANGPATVEVAGSSPTPSNAPAPTAR
jgi:LEA14-like dessication related protein